MLFISRLLILFFFICQTTVLAEAKKSIGPIKPTLNFTQAKHQLQIGNYLVAYKLILKIIEDDKQRYGREHKRTAKNLSLLATIVSHRGQLNKAKIFFLKSESIRQRLHLADTALLNENLFGLANINKAQGRYQQSLETHKKILNEKQQTNDTLSTIHSLLDITEIHLILAQYPEAQALLSSTETLIQKTGKNTPIYARWLNQKGTLATAKKHYSIANKYENQALEILISTYGRNNVLVANTLMNIANRLYVRGRYNLAAPLYLEAAAIYKTQLGTNSLKRASSLNNVAATYFKKEKDEKAIKFNAIAYEIGKLLVRANHPFFALNSINQARNFINKKQYALAHQEYLKAQKILEVSYGLNHPKVVEIIDNIKQLPL